MNWKDEYLPKQLIALEHLANTSPAEQVLFGGGAGGGKSWLGCRWQVLRRLNYPGTRGLIGRSKLDTLKKTTLNTFFDVCGQLKMVPGRDYNFNGQSHIIEFSNGSEIVLKDLFAYPSDPNFDSLGSLEITDYFIDEVSQVTSKAVSIVTSRCRHKIREYELIPKGFLSCNPHKGWLYNDFYAPSLTGELPAYRAFVQSLAKDNPHLPESYIQTLSRLPEQERKRLLEGDWDFEMSIDRIFDYDDLLRMFRNDNLEGEKYITADIARMGKDRTVLCYWVGLTLCEIRVFRRLKVNEVSDQIRRLMAEKDVKLKNVLADEDGVGGGVVDTVKCRGFINGSRPTNPIYQNLKAECYFKLGEFVEKGKITMVVPQMRDEILRELDIIRRRNPEGDGKLNVTSKEEIARIHGFSPDIADAIAMRMFFDLRPNYGNYSYATGG